jgi:hypothetical protein
MSLKIFATQPFLLADLGKRAVSPKVAVSHGIPTFACLEPTI